LAESVAAEKMDGHSVGSAYSAVASSDFGQRQTDSPGVALVAFETVATM